MLIKLLTITWAPFLIGLISSVHCIGMCGGIAGALAVKSNCQTFGQNLKYQVLYSMGRITSYAVMGWFVASFSFRLSEILGQNAGLVFRSFTGICLILFALTMTGKVQALAYIERAGSVVWRQLSPLTKYFMPVDRWHKAMAVGMLWGWLPCGLVYSNLMLATTTASAVEGTILMLSFGLGTLPAILLSGSSASYLTKLFNNHSIRLISALFLIVLGAWIIFGGWAFQSSHCMHSCHSLSTPYVDNPL